MKHNWKPLSQALGGVPRGRICQNHGCPAKQFHIAVGYQKYRWRPLVGKCHGNPHGAIRGDQVSQEVWERGVAKLAEAERRKS